MPRFRPGRPSANARGRHRRAAGPGRRGSARPAGVLSRRSGAAHAGPSPLGGSSGTSTPSIRRSAFPQFVQRHRRRRRHGRLPGPYSIRTQHRPVGLERRDDDAAVLQPVVAERQPAESGDLVCRRWRRGAPRECARGRAGSRWPTCAGEVDAHRLAHHAAATVGADQIGGSEPVCRVRATATVSATILVSALSPLSSWPQRIRPRGRAPASPAVGPLAAGGMRSAYIGLSATSEEVQWHPREHPAVCRAAAVRRRRRKSGRGRACRACRITCPTRPLAFGSSLGPGQSVEYDGRTPASASSQASISPLGPAPEMTTSAPFVGHFVLLVRVGFG